MIRPRAVRKPSINIVLVNPQIPQNTGCIGRTSLAYGARLVREMNFFGLSLIDKRFDSIYSI